jgi:O-antigen ligase
MPDLARRLRRDPTLPVRVLVLAAVVLTPVVFDLGTVKPFDLVKATTILFFGWLALGTWAALVLRRRARPRRFTMAYFAAAFLLVNTVGAIFSSTKYTSLFGWYGRYSGLIEIAVLIGIFYVVGCVYRERRDKLPEIITAIAIGSVAVNLYILMQRAGLDPIRWAQPAGGVPGQPYFGTMGNANFAGGFLAVTAPCLYYAFQRYRAMWQRALVGVWALGLLSALWFTSARNGMFALGAALLLVLYVHRARVPTILKAGFAVAVIVAVVLAFIVVVHPGAKKPPAALRRVDVLRSKTIEVRVAWWKAGLRMFTHRPIIGWGPETYVTHYQRFLTAKDAKLGDSETADKPHNVYVEHAAHTGVLGLVAYLGLIVVALRRGLRRLRDGPPDERVLGTTLLALLAAYLGQAFFSIDVMAIALLGWVILGAVAAWADPADDSGARPPGREDAPAGRRAAAGAVTLVGVLLAAVSTAPLKAEHEAKTGSRLGTSGSVDEVLGHFELAQRWNRWEPFFHGFPGNYLENKAAGTDDRDSKRDFLTEAVAEFQEMDALQPGYVLWKYSVGVAMGDLAVVGGASFEEAERWLDEARELAPYDWRVIKEQAELLNKWAVTTKNKREVPGLLCRALREAEDAVEFRKVQGETQLSLGRTLARLGHLDDALGPLGKAARHDDTRTDANGLLKEVRRLLDLPKKERPPVVECP